MLNWLLEEEDFFDKNSGAKARALGRNYGISMGTGTRKRQAEIYLRDTLIKKRTQDAEGRIRCNLHMIYDIPTLDELIRYDPDPRKNFDRVSALLVGEYFKKILMDKEIEAAVEAAEQMDSVFNRELFV
jgi:hypothetical protein